jgi:hypothetical protein
MAGDKKLSLEWIPAAYAAKETILPKKEIPKATTGTHLIMKSTRIYKTKKSRCN